ncbi:MAG: DUF4254 domain-containing protein [Elusimicrobiota bacterium]
MAETIGSIADKISIVELKIYHMAEQLERTDVNEDHKIKAKQKLEILKIQSSDLAEELDELIKKVSSGETKLKIYRQFKMYNDPIYRIKENRLSK